MRTITNPSGLATLNRLPPVSSYTASEFAEAATFSSALSHYSEFTFASDQGLYRQRTAEWTAAAIATLLHKASSETVCKTWSDTAFAILQDVFKSSFDPSTVALFALGKLGAHELNLS